MGDFINQKKQDSSGYFPGGVILDNCPNMLFLFDGRQYFAGCSRACLALLGSCDTDGLRGRPLRGIFAAPDGERGEWVEKIYARNLYVFENLRPAGYEDCISLQDGREFQCQIIINPVLTETGCLGTIMAVNDITELSQVKRHVEEVSLAKSSFLSNMSHEIRTPINAIKGLSELLALTPLNNTQSNYAHNIIASVNSLLNIINDVLDFSKIDSEKVEIIEGDYALADLIAEVVNIVGLRAAEKGLMLILDVSPDIPRILRGDDVRIKQIIVNVLGNAVKYTQQGRVIFKLYGEKSGTTGMIDLVCVVEDTGVGIKEEDIPGLFNPFYRADIRSNRNISGTGLGLSISRRLAESMNGGISVESVYGKGSIFTVRLPQGVADPSPLAVVGDARQKNVLVLENGARAQHTAKMLEKLNVKYTDAAAHDLNDLNINQFTHCIYDDDVDGVTIRRIRAKMTDCVFAAVKDMRYAMDQTEDYDAVLFMPLLITELMKVLNSKPRPQIAGNTEKNIDTFALRDVHILVVDDNDINLLVSGELLRSYKAQVTCAESGTEALELCEKTVFDLIFMDHMMPEMDGIETTVEIRKRGGPNKNTPIAALTANVIDDMQSRYIECGMNDFIGKPIDIIDLSRVLRQWIHADKIVSIQNAVMPDSGVSAEDEQPAATAMERLIISMDAFGMYVSDVMREIRSDYALYLKRMERIRTDLNPLVLKLRGEVAAQKWDDFAGDIDILASMIHDVGARDCSGRARKLCRAAKEHNADYIRGDFFSLMNNMYMLQKKMEVAVPIARGHIGVDTPFGDKDFCCGLLRDMQGALSARDIETADALMETLSSYSLDHDLDMILIEIGAKLALRDFDGAAAIHAKALKHCEGAK